MDNRDEQAQEDLKVLELYSELNDNQLFIHKYQEVTERLKQWMKYDVLHQVECTYGTKYRTLSDDRDINEKLEEFKKNNPIKIRK